MVYKTARVQVRAKEDTLQARRKNGSKSRGHSSALL